MIRLLTTLCLIFLPFAMRAQQMSDYLFNKLSPEQRPANKGNVTLPELANLMLNAKWHIMDDAKAIGELDILCIRFAPAYKTIADRKMRIEFLYNLTDYWVGRVATYPDSMLKYATLMEQEALAGKGGFERSAAVAAYQLSIAYLELPQSDFKNASLYSKKAIGFFHTLKDSTALCANYLQLVGIYTELGLYKNAAAYLDSTKLIGEQNNFREFLGYFFRQSGGLLVRQFSETSEPRLADSLNALIKKYNDSTKYKVSAQADFQADVYFFKTQLHYYQKQYKQSLGDIDSFLISTRNLPLLPRVVAAFNTFKGLNLIQTGQLNEGIAILERMQADMDEYYTGKMLEQLYLYEKENGNLPKALAYHEQMMAFDAKAQQLKHQGQVLEIEQQYDVATRDLQITRLESQQDKTRFLVALISLLVLAAIGFILFRQRNNQRKTQQLLNQIDDLTQMQILRIEEAAMQAEEKERKRIGQELHDDLGASLAGLVYFMRTKATKETSPEEKADMEKACALLESSYTKTRSKSHDIYHQQTDHQFVTMLRDNVSLFFKGTGVEVTVEIDDVGMQSLPVSVKTNILLITKEAIANIIKHAKASKVNLLLYQSNNNVHIEIDDNGVGFSSKQFQGKSLGLASIKHRLEKINGWLTIDSQAMGGTMLKAILPVA